MRRSDAALVTIQFSDAIRYGIMERIGKPVQKFWVKVRAKVGGLPPAIATDEDDWRLPPAVRSPEKS